MKCPHCGGEMPLESPVCPYCGSKNELAQEHLRDMQHYKAAFKKTEGEVRQTARGFAGVSVRAVILAVLIVACIVVQIMTARYYSFARGVSTKKASAAFKKHEAVLDGYLADGDYMAFAEYIEALDVRTYDSPYEEYVPLWNAAGDYEQVWTSVHTAVCGHYRENLAQYTANSVSYLLRYEDEDHWNNAARESEKYETYQAYYADIVEETKDLLVTWCGLTQEEADSLAGLTEAKRAVIIEDAMNEKFGAQLEE